MIFGESAGSTSVNLHLISPGSAGLFRRAVMESMTAVSQSWHPISPTNAGILF